MRLVVAIGAIAAMIFDASSATAGPGTTGCPTAAAYGQHARQALDVYRTHTGANDAPIVVLFHGGAWRAGDKSDVRELAQVFANQGALVVAANYRSALDGDMFPAQAADAADAVRWAIQNAGRCGASEDHIYLGGFSAGGHLATLLAVDTAWRERAGLGGQRLRGVMAVGGVFKIESVEGGFPRAIIESVFGSDETDWNAASPLVIVQRDAGAAQRQPFLLVYGEQELLLARRETERFAELLRSRDARVTLP